MDNVKLKVGIQSLLGYLPAIVIKNILDGQIDSKILPSHYKIKTVSLFADISGFTKLSESFAKKGRIGPEFLAFSLNRYMEQLINIIGKNGGDIFKFAGDAILVIWPQTDDLDDSCVRAIQCALDIQNKLNNVEISPNKRLSVKIGIGVGECMILVVGGQFKRCEYLCVGEALAQACLSETKATEGGQTICSEIVKNISNKFIFEEITEGNSHGHETNKDEGKFYKIIKMTGERVPPKAVAYIMRTQFNNDKLRDKLPILKSYVPAAVVKYLDLEKESWCKEIRMLGIMFLNLKVDLSQTRTDEGIQRIQTIVKTVQRCVYRTRGGLNKFLMDDKGSVMLICWGLPPLSAHDDHIRSVYTGLTLINELKKFGCGAYIGITTGSCFTGVCGTIGGRREYSLLGEIVNLSARYMQKAIYYAGDLKIERKEKVEYMLLIDERTKNLIQNKIFSTYCTEDNIKGFCNKFLFWMPVEDNKDNYNYKLSLFPDIRTHNYNVPMYNLPNNNIDSSMYLKKSLYMVETEPEQLKNCKEKLRILIKSIPNIYTENVKKKNSKFNEEILIRGTLGSGKSLFIRNLLHDFIDYQDFREMNQKFPFVFISFQSPITNFDPMNGWKPILKQIYIIMCKEIKLEKTTENIKFGTEKLTVNCDGIGRILFKSFSFSAIKFIEEILDTSLLEHLDLPSSETFLIYNKIQELPEKEKRDPFFEALRFEKVDRQICGFFIKMIKKYQKFVLAKIQAPLIFILEDIQNVDDLSYLMIKFVKQKLQGVCIICSYQDPMTQVIQNYEDKVIKHIDSFKIESTIIMERITEISDVEKLIIHHLEEKEIFKIDEKLLNIILAKAFKGNPLFILDITDSLVNTMKLVQIIKVNNKNILKPTPELEAMEEDNDWSGFTIPIRIEKILGNIIDDSLDTREIILLKHASVIGNMFDIFKLKEINPFSSLSFDDLYEILVTLDHNNIIEILYDLNPKNLVCKFAIPFLREVLYQRMLIEQKNDIHLSVARLLQNIKFSYLPPNKEIMMLQKHLKITEKTIINYMEEDDDNLQNRKVIIGTLNHNNLKILQVKDICSRLKAIDLRLEEDDSLIKYNPNIISGSIMKKSDKNITWESRYLVISSTKFIYWYTEENYKDNKMSLGSFDLKNLYSVELVSDFTIGAKKNCLMIHVSSWFKKDQIKGTRKFYFSVKNIEDTNKLVNTLNFLRVKSLYNDFAANYGLINLPLKHEVKVKERTIKMKFSNFGNQKQNKNHNNYLNVYARKSIQKNDSNRSAILKRNSHFSSLSGGSENLNHENDLNLKILKLKDSISCVFSFGLINILGKIQDVVFNTESIGTSEEKTIRIPKFLEYLSECIEYASEKKIVYSVFNNNPRNNINLKKIKEIENEDDISLNLSGRNKEHDKDKTIDYNGDEQKIEINSKIINNLKNSNDYNLISEKLKVVDVYDRDLDEILLENFL